MHNFTDTEVESSPFDTNQNEGIIFSQDYGQPQRNIFISN